VALEPDGTATAKRKRGHHAPGSGSLCRGRFFSAGDLGIRSTAS
jgi:hypothetical protein